MNDKVQAPASTAPHSLSSATDPSSGGASALTSNTGDAVNLNVAPGPYVIEVLASGTVGESLPVDDSLTRGFWVSLFLCFSIAALGSWWFIQYTDWYELVGGVFGLTGLFAWLGVVVKIVPKDRMERIEKVAFESVFDSPRTRMGLLAGLGVGIVVSLFFGTLQFECVQGGDQLVWIGPAGTRLDEQNEAQRVPANGRLRIVKCASWLAGEYDVRVSGFPEQRIAAKPWCRQDRQVPLAFLRPVVLIWPERSLITRLIADKKAGSPARLFVKIDGVTYVTECGGESIWVGYQGGNMKVPKEVRDLWQGYQSEPALLSLLLEPGALQEWPAKVKSDEILSGTTFVRPDNPLPRQLRPGQKVQGFLLRKGSSKADATTAEYSVRSMQDLADMVQHLPLQLVN